MLASLSRIDALNYCNALLAHAPFWRLEIDGLESIQQLPTLYSGLFDRKKMLGQLLYCLEGLSSK